MTHELKTIGWRKFNFGKARHHWRTRDHMTHCFSACGLFYTRGELEIDDTLPACPRCETYLSLYAIEDPAPPKK